MHPEDGDGSQSSEKSPLLGTTTLSRNVRNEVNTKPFTVYTTPETPKTEKTPIGQTHYVDLENKSHYGLSTSGFHESGGSSFDRHVHRMSIGENNDCISLTWKNVNVYVPQTSASRAAARADGNKHQGYKQILHDVSGAVFPGTLLAIIGASGAGKTTLLNTLTYSNRGGLIVDGSIRANGRLIGKDITNLSAYVQQDDLFIPTLKVKEQLWFQAMLRMDKHIPKKEREQKVNSLIHEMGLVKCADSFIGDPSVKKGISGGEMKRLAFACEILSNPPVLFCDEPTSGLDSFMAQNVVETLRYMATKGHTILCTIHQPASPVFAMFDRVLLLAEGRVAFMGASSDALSFFENCKLPCPLNFNPADHYVHTLAIIPGNEHKCRQRVKTICDKFQSGEHGVKLKTTIEDAENENSDEYLGSMDDAMINKSPYAASWLRQFQVVMWRCWVTNARNSAVTLTRFLQMIALGLIFGLLYMGQHVDQSGITNINGALFLIQTQLTFGPLFSTIMTFPPEFPIFLREHHKGVYRVDVYYLCKTLAEIPVFIILPTILLTLIYWFVGMNHSAMVYFVALLASILVCTAAVSFGYMLSSSSSSVTTVLAIAPIFIVPIVTIGGLYIDTASIPVYFLWLKYLSWITYANEILVTNQWLTIENISCSGLASGNNHTCLTSGRQVIDSLSLNPDNTGFDFVMLLVLAVFYRCISFLLLLIRSRKKR